METGARAVQREIKEELRAEIRVTRLLGTLENIFTFEGKPGHELVMVFETEFLDKAFYASKTIVGSEGDELPFIAEWVRVDEAVSGVIPLYPDGLAALLRQFQLI